jgi:DNA-binding HxlR family transcriptional regulator
VASDWSLVAHHHWLEQILKKLEQDALVARRTGKFTLAD